MANGNKGVSWYDRPARLIPGSDYADMLEDRSPDFTHAVHQLSGKSRKKAEREALKAIDRIRSGDVVSYRVDDPSIPASETHSAKSYGEDVGEYSILGEHRYAGWNDPNFGLMDRLFGADPDTIFIAGGRDEKDVWKTMAHEGVHLTGIGHEEEYQSQGAFDKVLEPFAPRNEAVSDATSLKVGLGNKLYSILRQKPEIAGGRR